MQFLMPVLKFYLKLLGPSRQTNRQLNLQLLCIAPPLNQESPAGFFPSLHHLVEQARVSSQP